jgi:hypothetical protein
MRKLLAHMNKSGLTFVLDRVTGEVIWAFTVPEEQNWISGITEDGKLIGRRDPVVGKPVDICPSLGGAKSWNSMAYSPPTGFLYAPVFEICNNITANPCSTCFPFCASQPPSLRFVRQWSELRRRPAMPRCCFESRGDAK